MTISTFHERAKALRLYPNYNKIQLFFTLLFTICLLLSAYAESSPVPMSEAIFGIAKNALPPVLPPPVNVTMNCDDANATNLATNPPAGTPIPLPTIKDCSPSSIYYNTTLFLSRSCPFATDAELAAALTTAGYSGPPAPHNTVKVVRRIYSATDIWGNSATFTNSPQYIYVVRNVGTPAVLPVTIGCEDPFPSITTNVPTPAGACGVSYSFGNDSRVNLCGKSYQVIRTWQIYDRCMGSSTLTQIISATDAKFPTLTVTGTSYDLVDAPSFAVCNGTFTPKQLQPTLKSSGTVGGSTASGEGTITINALADANVCRMGTFSLTVSGADNCGSTILSCNDSRFTVVNGKINGTVTGLVTTFYVLATDQCGNTSKVAVTVNFIDNIGPTAICSRAAATLTNSKEVTIRGVNLNNNSTDNCGIDQILVARNVTTMGASDKPAVFCNSLTYGCSDVGTNPKVWVRYIDYVGNYTDCCVPIDIQDRAQISCISGGDVSVDCNSPYLTAFETLFKTPNIVYDGCSNITPTVTNSTIPINCGQGSFTRKWVYSITTAAGTKTSNECSSVITVNPIYGFRVTPLSNQSVDCAGIISTTEQDRLLIVNSLKQLNTGATFGAASQATSGSGVYATCSAPVVSVSEKTFLNTEFCKTIIRTYVIKDFCQFSVTAPSQNLPDEFVRVDNGDYQSFVKDGGHYIRFTRTISINDRTPPTTQPITVADICDNSTNCNFSFTQALNGSDLCGNSPTSSNLVFNWRVFNAVGNLIAEGSTPSVSQSNLTFGTYTVYYTVSDFCGNISPAATFTVRGKECKSPQIICQNINAELSPNGSGGGSVVVPLSSLYSSASDNCTPTNQLQITLSTTDGGTITALKWVNGQWTEVAVGTVGSEVAIKYTCANILPSNNRRKVRIVVTDLAGNSNFCEATVTLQSNNIGICGAIIFTAAGSVKTENSVIVNSLSMLANLNSTVLATTAVTNGAFNMPLNSRTDVQIRPLKTNNDDALTGITTFDIALISKHVLGVEMLLSPYKMIAADVDKSGEIDATDMLLVRRFVLRIVQSLPAGNFRFVDKSFVFRNPNNPFGEDFPEIVRMDTLNVNTVADFVAIKLGDVNGSYNGTVVRNTRPFSLLANDTNIVAGSEYAVNISAEKMDVTALQGTFSFKNAKVKSAQIGNLTNMTNANLGLFPNAVTISWNGKTQAATDVLTIVFVAQKSGKLSDMLTFNSALTPAVANDELGNERFVNLKFNTGKVLGNEFALYQNQPNPMTNETTIAFDLPRDSPVRLTITSVNGKVEKVLNGDFKAGYNVVTVSKSDLLTSGVFYYHLETPENSASKKMIVIE